MTTSSQQPELGPEQAPGRAPQHTPAPEHIPLPTSTAPIPIPSAAGAGRVRVRYGFGNSAAWGITAVALSAFTFSFCGPAAKVLMSMGWSAGAVLFARLLFSALLMLPITLWSMRGKWRAVRDNWLVIVAYGAFGFAGMQGTYFVAAQLIPVTLDQLLQCTAPVLVVLWLWATTRHTPAKRTFLGIVLTAVGVVVLLDPFGLPMHPVGVAVALASAVCFMCYILLSGRVTAGLPTLGYIGLSLWVGTAIVGVLGVTGVLPISFDVKPTGELAKAAAKLPDAPFAAVHSPVALLIIMVLSSLAAYLLGVIGLRRAGPTVGGFLSFLEIPFTALTGWWFLAEELGHTLLTGGSILIAGIAVVKWGDVVASRRRLTTTAPTP